MRVDLCNAEPTSVHRNHLFKNLFLTKHAFFNQILNVGEKIMFLLNFFLCIYISMNRILICNVDCRYHINARLLIYNLSDHFYFFSEGRFKKIFLNNLRCSLIPIFLLTCTYRLMSDIANI